MKFGFIGVGNMGFAVATAVCREIGGEQVMICRQNQEKLVAQAEKLGCSYGSATEIAQTCDFVVLGVKPQMLSGVLQEIRGVLREGAVLVSMAAGVSMEKIQSQLADFPTLPIIRIMPNTPVAVGQGMTLYCKNGCVSEEIMAEFLTAMTLSGQLDDLPEHLFDAATVVAGCSPAFVDLFLEALADGGVACGLPRQKAMAYAIQAVYGSGLLAKTSGKHPAQLKDEVCSPGGSTIQGVRALEAGGLRSSVIEATTAAYEKTQNLGK